MSSGVLRGGFRCRVRNVACTTTLTLLAVAAAGAGSASALSLLPNCGARVSTTTFAGWSDPSSYFLVSNGGFESGTAGWTVDHGARVVEGNETFHVAGVDDAHSLALPAGARATSPATCVAAGENSVRLFVKSAGPGAAALHVQAFVQNPLTGLVLSTGFDVNASAATQTWMPTGVLGVPNLLGGLFGVQNLTLVFTTRGASTVSWNIDDVYVDPFKLR